jgi:hypothetical protein
MPLSARQRRKWSIPLTTEVLTVGIVSALLVATGLVVGLVVTLRPSVRTGQLEANPMVPRVSSEVHAGAEQVLIHLARTLHVATGRAEVGYGEIYIAGSAGDSMRLASRSEIGRGFDGEVRVHRTRRGTAAEYFILRMPGDDALHQRIAELDEEIADALLAIDPTAQVRRISDQRPVRSRRPGAAAPNEPGRADSPREDRPTDGLS